MVWLHGGGYTAGSGQELLSYDGENLARRGDVVVVSLNHRLNVFGYLDLSKFGYAASGNVGMLDIVARTRVGTAITLKPSAAIRKRSRYSGPSGGGGKVHDAHGDAGGQGPSFTGRLSRAAPYCRASRRRMRRK